MTEYNRVSPTTSAPYNSICQLIVTFPNGTQAAGSGCFVGRRVILTVAHVLYNPDNGGTATRIKVLSGRDGAESTRLYEAETSIIQFKEAFIPRERRRRDFAAIILESGDALPAGFPLFIPWRRKRRKLRGMYASLSGYPDGGRFGQLWEDREKIKRVRKRIIRYRHTALSGQSGAPLWTFRDGRPHVVGLHRGDWGFKEEGMRIDRERRNWVNNLVRNFS